MRSREIVFTYGRDTGTISCRTCGKSEIIDLTRFQEVCQEGKVKCPCGSTFDVFFDNRRYPRKRVKLPAQLFECQTGQPIADVTITSLALSGMSFTPSLTEHLQPGDRLRISFVLDDGSRAQIDKDIIIRNVKADTSSAQFAEHSYHHNLDFYLMPLLDT